MVRFCSAGTTSPNGIDSGVAPKRLSCSICTGEPGTRIFWPLRSASVLTGLCERIAYWLGTMSVSASTPFAAPKVATRCWICGS